MKDARAYPQGLARATLECMASLSSGAQISLRDHGGYVTVLALAALLAQSLHISVRWGAFPDAERERILRWVTRQARGGLGGTAR